jgi:hypothetical protein
LIAVIVTPFVMARIVKKYWKNISFLKGDFKPLHVGFIWIGGNGMFAVIFGLLMLITG